MRHFLTLIQPNGAHIEVDDSNIEEYLEKVLDMTLGAGVAAQVRAFQEGERDHPAVLQAVFDSEYRLLYDLLRPGPSNLPA